MAVVDTPRHVPVLLGETLRLLDPQPGRVVVDCTIGDAGHAAALAERVGPDGTVVGFDVDPGALAFAARRLQGTPAHFVAIRDNFVRVPLHMARLGLRADTLLADLGFNSRQMADPGRGLSFTNDGPLDMRFDPDGPATARHLLATLGQHELADLIQRYGEEPLARTIAQNVVRARAGEPIETTAQLVAIVVKTYGSRAHSSRMHPATRTFMALRIAVNEELTALSALLEHIALAADRVVDGGWLTDGARIAIISFHSLEDRLVKRAFVELERRGIAERLTRRPITAGDEEVASNPRSRSAKLRAIRLRS